MSVAGVPGRALWACCTELLDIFWHHSVFLRLINMVIWHYRCERKEQSIWPSRHSSVIQFSALRTTGLSEAALLLTESVADTLVSTDLGTNSLSAQLCNLLPLVTLQAYSSSPWVWHRQMDARGQVVLSVCYGFYPLFFKKQSCHSWHILSDVF